MTVSKSGDPAERAVALAFKKPWLVLPWLILYFALWLQRKRPGAETPPPFHHWYRTATPYAHELGFGLTLSTLIFIWMSLLLYQKY